MPWVLTICPRSLSARPDGRYTARSYAPCGANPTEAPMSREFSVVIERDADGYYVASVPELPGCHTQARSLDELMERVQEAIAVCLEASAPESAGLEFVGMQRVRAPA